jgi:hypothetical protein
MEAGHGDPCAISMSARHASAPGRRSVDAASDEVNQPVPWCRLRRPRATARVKPTLTPNGGQLGLTSSAVLTCRRRGPNDAAAQPIPAGTANKRSRLRELHLAASPLRREEDPMFDFRDLFQWERFITPSIIKIFYWLAVGIAVLFCLSGIVSGLTLMALSPLGGLFWVIGSLIGMAISVLFARIISEFVLIMFRINEHLGAIRQRGQM